MLKISGLNRKRRFDNKKVRQCLLCLSTTGISGGRKNEGYTKDRYYRRTLRRKIHCHELDPERVYPARVYRSDHSRDGDRTDYRRRRPDEFRAVQRALCGDEVEWRDSYDAVFHLVTAANGAEAFYNTANNAARYESVTEAVELDERLISGWTGHRYLRIIDNSTDFEEKMKRLEAEIATFLGEEHPYEMERKFLIRFPDLYYLENNPLCRKVEITQTYLRSESGEEIRIRRRGENGHYVYYETHKRSLDGMKRLSTEQRLSQSEYRRLLKNADPKRRTIYKTRYCLTYDNQYFEIDVYPFWHDKAIMEIEVREEDTEIRFPYEIKVIREVTGEPEYKNAALAMI